MVKRLRTVGQIWEGLMELAWLWSIVERANCKRRVDVSGSIAAASIFLIRILRNVLGSTFARLGRRCMR